MTEQRLRVRGQGPICMRSIRDGLLHAQVVESEFVIDRARDEHVVLSDAAGCLADVPEGQAEMDVNLVFRRVLIPRRTYPQVDQSLNIRELARRIAEVEFGEAPNFLSLEYWHLTACAAELFARTPSERLPWSYAKRFSAAFDVIRDAPDSKSSFRMALEGWAEEFFADDTNAEQMLRAGELPLRRLMEALGPTAAGEALREGAARSRRSRDAVVRCIFNINGQWDAVESECRCVDRRPGAAWRELESRLAARSSAADGSNDVAPHRGAPLCRGGVALSRRQRGSTPRQTSRSRLRPRQLASTSAARPRGCCPLEKRNAGLDLRPVPADSQPERDRNDHLGHGDVDSRGPLRTCAFAR